MRVCARFWCPSAGPWYWGRNGWAWGNLGLAIAIGWGGSENAGDNLEET